VMLARVVWHAGLRSGYRAEFWRFAWPLLLRGELAHVIRIGLMAHHMIISAREASAGRQTASHYSNRIGDMPVAAE
jgi:hopanoid C-2 methylase